MEKNDYFYPMEITIWHNQLCSTSRKALQFLEEKGYKITIKLYLSDNPSRSEIQEVVRKMGVKPEAILRKKEKMYQENYKDKELSSDQWYDILERTPILIERPIVISKDKAWLARPFDQWVKEFNPKN